MCFNKIKIIKYNLIKIDSLGKHLTKIMARIIGLVIADIPSTKRG